MTQPSVPPGWYTDPRLTNLQRRWDGGAWTSSVRPAKKHPSSPWPLPTPPPSIPTAIAAMERRNLLIGGAVIGAIVIAIVLYATLHKTSKGGSSSDSGHLVSKTAQNARAFASDTEALFTEISGAVDAGDDSALYQIATDARELRSHVDSFYDDLSIDVDLSDDDQSLMLEGLREVRAGIGTIQRWVDNPSPGLTDRWQNEFGTGIPEWNHAVTAIWDKAGVSDVPTISLG